MINLLEIKFQAGLFTEKDHIVHQINRIMHCDFMCFVILLIRVLV